MMLNVMLTTSELCTSVFTDLDMMVSCYNSALSSLLDKYAPPRTKSVSNRKRVPCFNHKIKGAIKARRRGERKWRYSKSAQDLSVFKQKEKPCNIRDEPSSLRLLHQSYPAKQF